MVLLYFFDQKTFAQMLPLLSLKATNNIIKKSPAGIKMCKIGARHEVAFKLSVSLSYNPS
jgi:primosomal replication protein N